jgi:hypothetical protein
VSPGGWLRGILAVAFLLAGTVFTAGPATAAIPCANCVQFYADITIAATASPATPVSPGTTHSYIVRVTNTGWRTGGYLAPSPWPIGPASGQVYVVMLPTSPDEYPLSVHNDSGVSFHCAGYGGHGLACNTASIPSGSTSQFTAVFQVPNVQGTYTCAIWADSYGWTEFNENNNNVTVTYQVGYPA